MIVARLVVGPLSVNCYLLGCESTKEAVVIDPGDNPEEIMKIIENKGLSLRHILATHGHFDHVGAVRRLQVLTSAPFSIHKEDLGLLESLQEQAEFFGCTGVERPSVDRFIDEGDTVQIGKGILSVLHTPGHSRGGVCYLMDGMVFVGDTLFAGSVGRTDFPGCSQQVLLESIRDKLLPLGNEMKVYPGHGPSTTLGIEARTNPFLVGMSMGRI